MSTSNPAWRNHYVPQFYLRQWCGVDGKLWCYERTPSGKLSERSVAPRATAFKEHLYSTIDMTPYLRERVPDSIEKSLLSPLDNGAARVFAHLASGALRPLTDVERIVWALFLNSLLERDPRVLREHDARLVPVAEQVASEMLARSGSPESRARMKNVLAYIDTQAMSQNAVRHHMANEIRDRRVVEHFAAQTFEIVPSGPGGDFITSDAPLVVNCGRNDRPISTLALALSPTRLFVMHPSSWKRDDDFMAQLALSHNLMLVNGAAQYLYSASPLRDGPVVRIRHAVEEHFGRRRDGSSSG